MEDQVTREEIEAILDRGENLRDKLIAFMSFEHSKTVRDLLMLARLRQSHILPPITQSAPEEF
jgi:hypothetical protein